MRLGRLAVAGIVLGIGLGGFVDGIVLHQILQWHHLVSSTSYPPTSLENLRVNTFWDGLFHAFSWLVTVGGLALMWRARQEIGAAGSGKVFTGSILAGWGIFNIVEGLVDHIILGIHHVREGVANPLAWDLGFFALSALLTAVGWALAQSGMRASRQEVREDRERRAA